MAKQPLQPPKKPRVLPTNEQSDPNSAMTNPSRSSTWKPHDPNKPAAAKSPMQSRLQTVNDPARRANPDLTKPGTGTNPVKLQADYEVVVERLRLIATSRANIMEKLKVAEAKVLMLEGKTGTMNDPVVTNVTAPATPSDVPNTPLEAMSTADPEQETHASYGAILEEALMYLRTVTDEGPAGNQRQSGALCELLSRIENIVKPEECL